MMGSRLRCASVCLIGVLAAGAQAQPAVDPAVEVVALSLAQADEEALRFTDMTRVDLRISMPGKRIMGLAEEARIASLQDDTGRVLIGPGARTAAEAAQAVADESGMQVTTPLRGSIRRDAVAIGPEAGYLTVPAVAPLLPAPGATRLEMTAALVVNVASDAVRTVTLEGVNLDDPWGAELQVDGARVRCSLDESSGSGAEKVSLYYCYGDGVDAVSISAHGSETVAIDDASRRPNLAVTGPVTAVTLDFVLPKPEPVEVPVQVSLGLGL